ncbi:MAG: NERD domain-containing protein [Chloroflexota bacterium]
MILLDNRVSDLVRGYDRISQADLRLQTEWRQHLLQNYASRRDQHASALSEYVGKARVLRPQLSIIAFVPLAMLIGGLVITVIGILAYAYGDAELTLGIGGVALLFAGAIGFGLPTILWFWQVKLAKPLTPAHPLHEDLLTRLTPQWRAKLHGALPAAISHHRDAGKQSFVKHLQDLAIDSMYVLYDLRQERGDSVDVIVLGAKGVWIFIVEGWSGRVSWRDGAWCHEQFDSKRDQWIRLEEDQPDEKWRRVASQVAKTLSTRTPDLLKRFSMLGQIKGGIVFTDPKTDYEIPSTCPARWGMFDSWDQEIMSAPIIQGLDDRAIFGLLDALLERHHAIGGDAATISMSAYATKMIRRAEARLRGWVKH